MYKQKLFINISLKKHFKIGNINYKSYNDMIFIAINVHRIGWIKNPDGSWSKDPQAEFDSDDDW